MPRGHKVVIYDGPEQAFLKRWICVCGILMPRVAFGIPLNRAFKEHCEEASRSGH